MTASITAFKFIMAENSPVCLVRQAGEQGLLKC